MTDTLNIAPGALMVAGDAPVQPAPLVFLDTESDGLRPDCRVWEIAMIRREPDYAKTKVDYRLQFLVSIRAVIDQ